MALSLRLRRWLIPGGFALLAALGLGGCRPPEARVQASLDAHADCIFCKIVAGTAPSKKVYEDRYVLAFWDIRPRAKVHLLVIPKQHVVSLKELDELPVETRAALLSACVKVARDQGIVDQGFRVIANTGKDANQSVFHLHFHVVGGEKLREDAITQDPPGGR
jgi:histidine triad (HIT) family protein